MTNNLIIFLLLLPQFFHAQSQTKIIDMHIHSYTESDFGEREPASDHYGVKGSKNADSLPEPSILATEAITELEAVVDDLRDILNLLDNE